MACFLVSSVAAVGTAIVRHSIEKRNKDSKAMDLKLKNKTEIKYSNYLKYLELALFSASFILAGEHFIHGEISIYPPFLIAIKSPDTFSEMIHEMLTVGVAMTAVIFLVWFFVVSFYKYFKYFKHLQKLDAKEEKCIL